MEAKGIIIDQKDYDRLTEIEKNFDKKVKENKDGFEKGLKEAIKGNLVKVLWVNDKTYADIMRCDLEKEEIGRFIRREDADLVEKTSFSSYNREELLETSVKENTDNKPFEIGTMDYLQHQLLQHTINTQKKTIHNLWWAFGIMFGAWVILLVISFI